MSGVVKFSEAASLALHTMALLSAESDRHMSVREIAKVLPVSENHLAKVMQRLVRAGMVESVRGPRGGFLLRGDPAQITLLHVYEAIEGPLQICQCLMSKPQGCDTCILGDVIGAGNLLVRERMARTRLSEIAGIFKQAGRIDLPSSAKASRGGGPAAASRKRGRSRS